MQKEKESIKKLFQDRLYRFVLDLLKFCDKLPKDTTSVIIGKQLIRSGTSVLANYIEASAASSRKDYTNFFTHSLKSANESKIWLRLLKDANKCSGDEVGKLLQELTEIANILASSILTLKGKRNI